MELTVSDIGAIAAAVFAGGSLLHSIRTHNKQKDLMRELSSLQRELTALELKDAKARAISKEKAEFSARFVNYGSQGSKQLVITNVGSSQARNVQIDFQGKIDFVMRSEVEDYFPCNLDSSESVKLLASSSLSHTAIRESFTLSWMDNAGGNRKDFNVQYR
ncbi:Uncharacterised protein [Shewanella baltica]|jgi:hypothetical protein|uniref:hypothetical protein n=1 Tax=Shewanella TaxID=22 RepID=UPI000F717E55|nr:MULTISPECIES: hypothetical protein [Shewanella]MCS6097783.1 hypothetical protein [Shewanella baltica]MCS6225317.1 hypothetical protein [Shewanella baltica]WAL77542.1 hypothetical protein OX890_15500 [Shewanella sp. DAU305]VEF26681.1 Uncharacterised protein [Shewanella baltica]